MRHVFLFLPVLLLAACVDDGSGTAGEGTGAVQFRAASLTRTTGNTWDAGDAIGVYMMKHGTTEILANVSNRRHAFSTATNTFTPGEGQQVYYPVNGDLVDFIAYYPHAGGATLDVDISDQSDPAAIDLLRAATITSRPEGHGRTNASPVELLFDHQLSKISITTLAGYLVDTLDMPAMPVALTGLHTRSTFDVLAGTLGGQGTVADITPFAALPGKRYEAIVLPGTIADDEVTVTFTLGDDLLKWKIPARAFEPGKEYLYALTLSLGGGGTVVEVSNDIRTWDLLPAVAVNAGRVSFEYEIGNYYPDPTAAYDENGELSGVKPVGVVIAVSADKKHGTVAHLRDSALWYQAIDNPAADAKFTDITTGDNIGQANTRMLFDYIISSGIEWTLWPMANWIYHLNEQDVDGLWFAPSLNDVRTLYSAWNNSAYTVTTKNTVANAAFNKKLTDAGGNEIKNTYYYATLPDYNATQVWTFSVNNHGFSAQSRKKDIGGTLPFRWRPMMVF